MKIYRIHCQQRLAITQAEAWAFFSSPHNLNSITPDFFHVDITSPVPDDIYAGLLISYRMRAVLGLPMSWLSEVSQCDKPRRFVYQQRVGPFDFWSHEVAISEISGGILLEDIVFYTMRWSLLGRCLHNLLIGAKLQRIFATRRDYLQTRWGMQTD